MNGRLPSGGDPDLVTRTILFGLSSGFSLPRALELTFRELGLAEGGTLDRVARDLESDAFRAEAIARLPLRPPVLALLLSRASPGCMPALAAVGLRALRRRVSRRGLHGYFVFLALLALGISGLLLERTGGQWVLLAATSATLALALTWLAHLEQEGRRIGLDGANLLRWLVMGELAGVAPGAVFSALGADRGPFLRRRLFELQRAIRGAADSRSAAVALSARSLILPRSARPYLSALGAEGPDATLERAIRVLGLDRARPRRSPLEWCALVAIGTAVLALGIQVLEAIAALAERLG